MAKFLLRGANDASYQASLKLSELALNIKVVRHTRDISPKAASYLRKFICSDSSSRTFPRYSCFEKDCR